MRKIRVAMCDDAEFLCVNIQNHMKYVDDLEFVGYTTDSAACVEMVRKTSPDILLLDIQMETKTSGIDILPALSKAVPDLKIIMLTSYMENTYVFNSLTNGAVDYIIKSCSNNELIEKIREVFHQTNTLEPEIFRSFKQRSQDMATAHRSLMFMMNKLITLSSTELALLKALCDGESYNDIAKKRVVENVTVRSMGSRILKKFGVGNMDELIKSLRSMKIFDLFSDD